jgi:quercetin dioxygenase-like cupin family protein
MLVKIQFEKGGIGAVHNHLHTQISYVETGVFEVQINGEIKILNMGDAFYIPPHADHGVVCLESGILIDAFSPMRKDFIKIDGQS